MKGIWQGLLLLPWLVQAQPQGQTEDIKCYVTLAGGYQVVLQQPVADTRPANLITVFKQKGYEIDGVVRPVVEVQQCVPLTGEFSLVGAKQQDENQPR
ncbi:MAG: type IVa secretion system protein TapY2 [Plesiomonas sp.]